MLNIRANKDLRRILSIKTLTEKARTAILTVEKVYFKAKLLQDTMISI